MKKAKDVDEYTATAPKEVQGRLKQLRATIKSAAPNAEERVSYGIPHYDYKGRLVYFGLAKNHIGLYITTPIIAEHKNELRGFKTTDATICLPLDKKLPIALIKKLVRARVKKNESLSARKKAAV